jgi:hypothetical protein
MEALQIKWLHKPGYTRTTMYVQKLLVKGTKLIATSLLFIVITQGNVSVGSFWRLFSLHLGPFVKDETEGDGEKNHCGCRQYKSQHDSYGEGCSIDDGFSYALWRLSEPIELLSNLCGKRKEIRAGKLGSYVAVNKLFLVNSNVVEVLFSVSLRSLAWLLICKICHK